MVIVVNRQWLTVFFMDFLYSFLVGGMYIFIIIIMKMLKNISMHQVML